LRDFDQIMNVEDKVIDEKSENTLDIDNTHLPGDSTLGDRCRSLDG